jgi:uncharacterized membrane protein YfcA
VEWTPIQIALVAAIALTGGTLGGLLGLGGSVFIIPTITFLLGPNYHLYQASALIANVFVASAATRKHRGRGTIRRDVVPVMAAAAAVMALLGVFTSNVINAAWLYIVFGAFLCYASTSGIIGLLRRKPDAPDSPIGATRWRLALATGAIGGFLSGLLGIGGGAIMVPILRKFGKIPLRQAVASSACVMIAACVIGAIAKNASLLSLGQRGATNATLSDSLWLAAILAPSAMIGATLGAALVYRLPTTLIRSILSVLLAYVGIRMVLTGLS